ncbi:MAG: hypothetical protein EF813_02840 [Methanosarcinales archaeon]|nr:MAG: hypothetical protein EF813_02840 [Methanosarcinales archaeon]
MNLSSGCPPSPTHHPEPGKQPQHTHQKAVPILRFKEIAEIAKIDCNRSERTGIPEAVLAEGKSPEDLVHIVRASISGNRGKKRILITKVSDAQLNLLKSEIDPQLIEWNKRARTLVCGTAPLERT